MNTKILILAMLCKVEQNTSQQLKELFTLMRNAVQLYESDEIDWHLINGLSEFDILLLITMSDAELSVNFNVKIIEEAVAYVRQMHRLDQKSVYH